MIHGFDKIKKTQRRVFQKMLDLVSSTYGPQGRYILMERNGQLLPTKDGFSVIRELSFPDRLEDLICLLVKRGSFEVSEEVGDGTTAFLLLLKHFLEESEKMYIGGAIQEKMFFEKNAEILQICTEFIRDLPDFSDPSYLYDVARIASNGEQDWIKPMVDACLSVGKYGKVLMEDGQRVETTWTKKSGYEISHKGLPALCRNSSTHILEGPLVAFLEEGLIYIKDVVPILEQAANFPGRPLLILSPYVSGEARDTLLLNTREGVLDAYYLEQPVVDFWWKLPDIFGDLASMSGGEVFSMKKGVCLKDFQISWFGSFRKITLGHTNAVFEAYEDFEVGTFIRIQNLKAERERETSQYSQDLLDNRIALLSDGLAVIKFGGYTESEMKEKRSRAEDTLYAIQAGMQEGLCFGGGYVYFLLSDYLREHMPNDPVAAIWEKALLAPIRYLSQERPYASIVEEMRNVKEKGIYGWDAKEQRVRDLTNPPYIFDTKKGTRVVLEKMMSLAQQIFTISCGVTQ